MVGQRDHVQMVTGTNSQVSWSHSESLAVGLAMLSESSSCDSLTHQPAAVVNFPKTHLALNGESFGAVKLHHPKDLKKVSVSFREKSYRQNFVNVYPLQPCLPAWLTACLAIGLQAFCLTIARKKETEAARVNEVRKFAARKAMQRFRSIANSSAG